MSDQIMTPMIGKWRAYTDGTITGGTLGLVALKLAGIQADATLRTHATLAAILAANAEATFTNYARKTGIVPTPIPGTAQYATDIPDQTFASAGTTGAPENLAKLVLCWYPTAQVGTTSAWLPLCHLDWPEIANGADLTATVNASGVLLAAA